nr:hypothetical protein [Tanacetum cinerariifolium]
RKAHLLEDKQIPSVGVFSTWMAFGGNTSDLGSFGEETDEITDLHQFHEEILFSECGDGVAGIKQRRHDPSSDDVRDLVTASGRGRLNGDLESSTVPLLFNELDAMRTDGVVCSSAMLADWIFSSGVRVLESLAVEGEEGDVED